MEWITCREATFLIAISNNPFFFPPVFARLYIYAFFVGRRIRWITILPRYFKFYRAEALGAGE
ncbi:hypothetical protein DL93DRAFT_451906 [Clavulina sp. PMI_390]|nr:hypothetical protein DL93DRAFT_451906 [Clavulina sp. PMI_390]